MLKKKLLGLIIGSGAIGGGVVTYLYLNKSDTVLEEPAKPTLDRVAKNRAWAKNKFKEKWDDNKYKDIDFSLNLKQDGKSEE